MRHRVFCNINKQVFKDPVCFLAVQMYDQPFFRKIAAELHTGFPDLFIQFQFYLFKQIYHIQQVQFDSLAVRFAHFKQIFDQYFQSQ